jgi:hypothetical protein
MFEYNLCIAEISFRVKSYTQIPRLNTERYLNFSANKKIAPDILIRIKKAKHEITKKNLISNESIEWVLARFKLKKEVFYSNFFFVQKSAKN